jgi:hypothetical protein
MQHFLNPLTVTSGHMLPCCLDSLSQQFYTGLLYFPSRCQTEKPFRIQFIHCNIWNLVLEVIPPGMTTRSVFIADLAFGVAPAVQLACRCARLVKSENGVVAGWWDIRIFFSCWAPG